METGIENEEPVEEVIKLISAKDIRDTPVKNTSVEVVNLACKKTINLLCQFARTAQESGSDLFRIPINIVFKYIENFEPRAEMLFITDDVYSAVISDLIGLGYELTTAQEVTRSSDQIELLIVSWADDSV